MEIVYFNRQPGNRFSIEKVTDTIIQGVSKNYTTKSFRVPKLRATLINFLSNIIFVWKNRTNKGLNHITGDIHYCMLGLIGCKSVLTIHDTVFLNDRRNLISFCIKWMFWLFLPCILADKVICISEKTKQELKRYHIPTKNVQIIYNPVQQPSVNLSKDDYSKPLILHIGTKPNKNLPRVIESLNGLNCKLIIVGKLTTNDISRLEQANIDYSNYTNISDVELAHLYKQSDIISFPSLYEGFGMPIIEGQLSGCCVLTSKISPMTEIGQDSVYYVNPNDINSIRNGFKELIENNDLRVSLIKKGEENAKRFSPDKIAEEYIDTYKKIY